MGQRAPRETVLAWLREHPAESCATAARHFDYHERTVQRWAKKAGLLPRPEEPRPSRSAGRSTRARGAPAAELPEDDREQALQIVRDSRFVLSRTVAHLRRLVEADPEQGLQLDRDSAQALLNLERCARDVIDSHPGLLALAAGDGEGEEEEEAREQRLRRIREALEG